MESIPSLLNAARTGDPAALEALAQHYRPWLLVLAQGQVGRQLAGKCDASDVVQQVLLDACRGLPQFRGTTEAEWCAWLRQVLARALGHELRRYAGTRQRDVGREVSLEQQLTESSCRLGALVASPDSSPSQRAVRHEQELHLAAVLARLPEDYRTVIVLRDLEGLPHEEVARRMDRGVGAVRMLWVRALARLRQEMERAMSHGALDDGDARR
jgi:RNA polymerase sigma-70 factor (ECF subfamily)